MCILMIGLLLSALILAGLVIVAAYDGTNPFVGEAFLAILLIIFFAMYYRPDSVKRKEKDEFVNTILKYRDDQRIVDKCSGCARIEKTGDTCSIYQYPWEPWKKFGKCENYRASIELDDIGEDKR